MYRNQLLGSLVVLAFASCGDSTQVVDAQSSIVVVSGGGQSATVGTRLASPIIVRVINPPARAIEGALVNFRVISGGGSVYAGSALTDANGQAQDLWTLGDASGLQEIEARAIEPTTGATLTTGIIMATGLSDAPAHLVALTPVTVDGVAGSPLVPAPSVQVADRFGNPVQAADLQVTFGIGAGGGTVTDAVVTTDANGIATVGSWTLGVGTNEFGGNTLIASAPGLDGVTFVATGRQLIASFALQAGDGQTAAPSTAVAIPPAVKVTDQFGNGVAGYAVTFTVTAGGGSTAAAIVPTDGNGIAATPWTLGSTGGIANTLAASAGAVTGSPVTFTAMTLEIDGTTCTNDSQCVGGGCLEAACVTLGGTCFAASDCATGQYCETAFGSPGGGIGSANPVCTATLPPSGTCVASPTATCTNHPLAGTLDAVPRWTWGPTATSSAGYTDVWSTPAVGRLYDSNCDGVIDALDSPSLVFVAGNDSLFASLGGNCEDTMVGPGVTMCRAGALRMIDGTTGQEIWTIDHITDSQGFAGTSVAIGDIHSNLAMDIVAVTAEGYVVLFDNLGNLLRTSDKPIPGYGSALFGWGGGLAIADADNDGFPEIAYGSTVYATTNNAITLKFTGTEGTGGGSVERVLSTFVDLDGAADNHLELLAGNTAYKADGSLLWHDPLLPDGYAAVADFNHSGSPQVALVGNGQLWILDGGTGAVLLGPVVLPGTGLGGAPAIADVDHDGFPEIGVAMAGMYSMMKPDFTNNTIDVMWQMANHDTTSSVTASTAFDFEGNGNAAIIYSDECFLWVFDGTTGAVRFAASHTSFTGTEAPIVVDVDGDGHAELIMVSNGVDPTSNGFGCETGTGMMSPINNGYTPVTVNGYTWVPSNALAMNYRGIVAFGDSAHAWLDTRTLWNEHTYHVSNICDDRDGACGTPNTYGSIPTVEAKNWTVPWLDNFGENAEDTHTFDAADAVVSLVVGCASPTTLTASVRDIGSNTLPAGVGVIFSKGAVQVGASTTTRMLQPGQTEELSVAVDPLVGISTDTYAAQIVTSAQFVECRTDNDSSASATCVP